jgi:cell division protein FtsB
MTGIEASAEAPQPTPMRSRWRLPASRGGVAWLIVLLIIGTLLAVQFGRQVYANWEIGQQASRIEAQIAAIEAENAQLQAELDYLRSDAYVSAEARRLANLGDPGERVLIIPPGAEAPLPLELSATRAAEADARAVVRALLRRGHVSSGRFSHRCQPGWHNSERVEPR